MKSFDNEHFWSAIVVSTQESCKALDGMYTIASPDSQASHRHFHANQHQTPNNKSPTPP